MPNEFQSAPTGRAKCRGCKETIAKGELRLGEDVPNAFGEGAAKHWYHLNCGARRRPEAFLAALASLEGGVPGDGAETQWERLRAEAELGVDHPRLCHFVRAELATSGRSRCRGCQELIESGNLRFVLERIDEGVVTAGGFVHVQCAHAYAGAVDELLNRLPLPSGLSEAHLAELERVILLQQKLERVVPTALLGIV